MLNKLFSAVSILFTGLVLGCSRQTVLSQRNLETVEELLMYIFSF